MVEKIHERLLDAPTSSFFLLGARGTGKSTWARMAFGKARWFDLLDEGLFHDLLADPSLLAAELESLPEGAWVVIDEVQRIPGLLNEVHRFIERRGLRFALLGSSARQLKRAGTNLLAGRASWKTLFPFVPEEIGAEFDLERVLEIGSIPVIWNSPEPRTALVSYAGLYLKEEIRAEALVRNVPGFVRFLPVVALCHGQVVNVSAIARDAGTARTTVATYLDILEDTLLATRLPAFEARLRVRERKHPKFYWLDPGVVGAIKRRRGEIGDEERGALLEGWVLTLLRTYAAHRGLCDEIYYWAPGQGGLEVDFLLRRGDEFLAIEVKGARRYQPSLARGLAAIRELTGVKRRLLLYRGRRRLAVQGGIEVWPIPTFLEALASGRLWP